MLCIPSAQHLAAMKRLGAFLGDELPTPLLIAGEDYPIPLLLRFRKREPCLWHLAHGSPWWQVRSAQADNGHRKRQGSLPGSIRDELETTRAASSVLP